PGRPRSSSHRRSRVQGVRTRVPSGESTRSAGGGHPVHEGRTMTRRPTVAVFDYESGNVHSAVKALIAAGADATLTADRKQLLEADGLLVPGVGAFAAVRAAPSA